MSLGICLPVSASTFNFCIGSFQIACEEEKVQTELTVTPIELPKVSAAYTGDYAVRLTVIGNATLNDVSGISLNGVTLLGQSDKILVVKKPNGVQLDGVKVQLSEDAFVGDTVKVAVTIYDPNGAGAVLFESTVSPIEVVGFDRAVVPMFNPATNVTQASLLRVTNTSSQNGIVAIVATDDAGQRRPPVYLLIGAGKSIQLTADEMENGAPSKGLVSGFGKGVGKWRLALEADFTGLTVQSLVRNNLTGTLSTVSDSL